MSKINSKKKFEKKNNIKKIGKVIKKDKFLF